MHIYIETNLKQYDESLTNVFVVDFRLQQPVVDMPDDPLVRKSPENVCMYVCVCTYVCMYVYMCMYICMYVRLLNASMDLKEVS